MPSAELERLVETGLLQREPPIRDEFGGLLESAGKRLADAERRENSLDSRFDLAYNAGHALAVAALRWHGYRAQKRYIVFQSLPHSLGTASTKWRLLARCHDERNRIEYEGQPNLSEKLVADLITVARELVAAVRALPPIPSQE